MPDPAHGIELCEEAARLSEAPLYCGDEQTTRAAGMLGPCRRMHEAALEPRQSVANVWDVGLARVRSDGIREPQSAMGDVGECFPVGPTRGFVRHPSHRGHGVRRQFGRRARPVGRRRGCTPTPAAPTSTAHCARLQRSDPPVAPFPTRSGPPHRRRTFRRLRVGRAALRRPDERREDRPGREE